MGQESHLTQMNFIEIQDLRNYIWEGVKRKDDVNQSWNTFPSSSTNINVGDINIELGVSGHMSYKLGKSLPIVTMR